MHLHEVEVLERWQCFVAFGGRRLPLEGGALQVELLVDLDPRREQVVHDDQPDVLGVAVVAVEAEELGQQGARVLHDVHVVGGQQLLQKFRLLVGDRFDDEVVVVGHVEYGPAGARVREFAQRRVAEGEHEVFRLDSEDISKVPGCQRDGIVKFLRIYNGV